MRILQSEDQIRCFTHQLPRYKGGLRILLGCVCFCQALMLGACAVWFCLPVLARLTSLVDDAAQRLHAVVEFGHYALCALALGLFANALPLLPWRPTSGAEKLRQQLCRIDQALVLSVVCFVCMATRLEPLSFLKGLALLALHVNYADLFCCVWGWRWCGYGRQLLLKEPRLSNAVAPLVAQYLYKKASLTVGQEEKKSVKKD